jgi:hypothetical protein
VLSLPLMVFSYIMCCSRDKTGISWAGLWSGILFLLVLLYTLLIDLSREVYPISLSFLLAGIFSWIIWQEIAS